VPLSQSSAASSKTRRISDAIAPATAANRLPERDIQEMRVIENNGRETRATKLPTPASKMLDDPASGYSVQASLAVKL
jgi:hypothetical protein